MTPAWRARHGCCDAQGARWRPAGPLPLSSKCVAAGGGPKTWPPHVPHPARAAAPRIQCPPPPPLLPATLPLFHSRHAEHGAERPRLVTVVRPYSQGVLRKVTVLLNRRGVVSFEQLLLDVSEALGFPRWHRARVTRLYTPHAREVKGVCDFFRGEVAFLALGKARPELQSVLEALEELFPEHSRYRADAFRAWERRLRPAPDKASKNDSGYSEGTDSSGTQTHPDAQGGQRASNHAHAKGHYRTHRPTQPPQRTDAHRKGDYDSDPCAHPHNGKYVCRQPTHPPNHLQRVQARDGARERKPSLVGPSKPDEGRRETNRRETPSPALCRNCLAGGGAKYQTPERPRQIPGKVPLPPVTRRQRGSPFREREATDREVSPPPQPITRDEAHKCHKLLSNPLPGVVGPKQEEETQQPRVTFGLPTDGSHVALSDVERRYDMGRVVGDGNFAVVRECRCRDTGEAMAMKIVDRSKLVGREHMMQNELSLLGSLSHARVVRLFAHYHTPTHSYLLMELVAGGDLFEAIAERGKFPEEEAGMMVSDVSEALTYIHCRSIVHRDLKPENLLLERQADSINRLKLGDFGLAMVVTEPIFTICGTPTYVAPEILSETGYGLAVDVWALGVILYILLCGFPPFRSRDRDQEELFQLIKQGDLHFLSPYWDSISDGARNLVKALLQADPTARLTAAQTFQHPWVQAMTAACSQGALADKTQESNTATTTTTAQSGTDQETPEQQQRPEATGEDERPATASSSHVAGTDTAEEQTQIKPDSSGSEESPAQSTGAVREDRAPDTVSVRAASQEIKADGLHTPLQTSVVVDQQQTQQTSAEQEAAAVSPTSSPNQLDDAAALVQSQPADAHLPTQEGGPQQPHPNSPTPPQDKSDLHTDPPVDASSPQ